MQRQSLAWDHEPRERASESYIRNSLPIYSASRPFDARDSFLTTYDHLLSPLDMANTGTQSRTCLHVPGFAEDNKPGEQYVAYHRNYAKNGVGLQIIADPGARIGTSECEPQRRHYSGPALAMRSTRKGADPCPACA